MNSADLLSNLWLALALLAGVLFALLPAAFVGAFNNLVFDISRKPASELKGGRRRPDEGAYVRVENGEIAPESTPNARYMGGPGLLAVDGHSVAVLEKVGHFTRAVGIGMHTLDRNERVVGAIDLRAQLRKTSGQVLTRDGIPIGFEVEIEYRLLDEVLGEIRPPRGPLQQLMDRSPHAQAAAFEHYRFSAEAARLAVYPLAVLADGTQTRWGGLVEQIAMTEIGGVLSAQEFDDLCVPGEGDATLPRARRSLRRRIQLEAEAAAARALRGVGARLLGLRFNAFTFDQDEARAILDQHFADWLTHWASEMRRALAEGEQRAIEADGNERAKAQAVKLSALSVGIVAALHNSAQVDELAMLRALEALERLSTDQPVLRHMPREVQDLIEELQRKTGTLLPSAASQLVEDAPPAPDSAHAGETNP